MKAIYFSWRCIPCVVILFCAFPWLAARAQSEIFVMQTFDHNMCGWAGVNANLVFDPTQDNTGNHGGSCHVGISWSQPQTFIISGSYQSCCDCLSEIELWLTNFASVDFDLKWDPASTVWPAQFNFSLPVVSSGLAIVAGGGISYSNVFIPGTATNGWVHFSVPINPLSTGALNRSLGLDLYGTVPADGAGTAAFWLDNVELVRRGPPHLVPGECSQNGNSFTLSWTANPGDTCTVLKSADLIHWTTVVTGYPAGGLTSTTASFTDTNATDLQAFYRIRDP